MNPADHFEAIVCEHYQSLFRFAMSLTRAESDAWDLTQQTFFVWARKGDQLRDPSKVKTWLFTTLHRVFLAARRKETRFPHEDLDTVSNQLPDESPVLADRVDSSQVLSALARVDEIYQAAVALFYLEECPYKDIAVILEVPVGTVKSRIARGIAQLRKILSSGDCCASSIPIKERTDAREEKTLAPARPHSDQATEADRAYDAWDFSSTLLTEPIGSA